MLAKAIMVGVAAVLAAAPAGAQQRGTVEFGVFGSNTSFDNDLGLNNSFGPGARIGVFMLPRLSAEFEAGGSKASRDLGLASVNVGVLSARLTAVPLKFGRVSVLLGGGVDHTDTYFVESYGVHGLLGLKYAFSDIMALRIDGIDSYMANGKATNLGLHVGLSFYRNPVGLTRTVINNVPAAPLVQRPDSVSAAETRRLRALAFSYQSLRDSLARNRPQPIIITLRDTLVLEDVTFAFDSATLTPESHWVLDRVAASLLESEWINTRWEIGGHTSSIGTHEINMSLSQHRAEVVRAYLVMRGVPDSRLTAKGFGEVYPMYPNDSEGRNWRNRRVELRRIKP